MAPIFIRFDTFNPEEGQPSEFYVQVAHLVGFHNDPLGEAGAILTVNGYDEPILVTQTIDQIRSSIYNEILYYK